MKRKPREHNTRRLTAPESKRNCVFFFDMRGNTSRWGKKNHCSYKSHIFICQFFCLFLLSVSHLVHKLRVVGAAGDMESVVTESLLENSRCVATAHQVPRVLLHTLQVGGGWVRGVRHGRVKYSEIQHLKNFSSPLFDV